MDDERQYQGLQSETGEGDGASRDDFVRAYPHLTAEDVEEALRYAAHFLKNDVLISVEGSH